MIQDLYYHYLLYFIITVPSFAKKW